MIYSDEPGLLVPQSEFAEPRPSGNRVPVLAKLTRWLQQDPEGVGGDQETGIYWWPDSSFGAWRF